MLGPPESAEPVKRDPERFRDFFTVSPSGARGPVPGQDGHDPAGYLRAKEAGIWVVGYRSQDAFLELDAQKFETYLREEGLEHVIEKRRELDQSGKAGRESYSRCAKSLISVGAGGTRSFDRLLDFPLELVAEKDPYRIAPGTELPIRLLRDGAAAPDILVAAIQRNAANAVQTKLEARTDAAGRVSFMLPAPGVWTIKCVAMSAAKDPARADWDSLWATLTFELPATGADSAPASRPDSRK